MSTTVRDPWADAWVVATQSSVGRELAAARRRLQVRRAAGLFGVFVAGLGVYGLVNHVLDPDLDGLWSASLHVLWFSFGLMGLALLVVIVGAVRTTRAARPFVAPDAFLLATDRAWLRDQVAQGRAVPGERYAVVADAAHRMTVEGRYVPTYLGFTLLYVGVIVGGASVGTVVTFSALVGWMLVRAVRGALWSARGRRWLALHGPAGRVRGRVPA